MELSLELITCKQQRRRRLKTDKKLQFSDRQIKISNRGDTDAQNFNCCPKISPKSAKLKILHLWKKFPTKNFRQAKISKVKTGQMALPLPLSSLGLITERQTDIARWSTYGSISATVSQPGDWR